jgi:hypothetical protein
MDPPPCARASARRPAMGPPTVTRSDLSASPPPPIRCQQSSVFGILSGPASPRLRSAGRPPSGADPATVTVEHVAGVAMRHPSVVAAGRDYGATDGHIGRNWFRRNVWMKALGASGLGFHTTPPCPSTCPRILATRWRGRPAGSQGATRPRQYHDHREVPAHPRTEGERRSRCDVPDPWHIGIAKPGTAVLIPRGPRFRTICHRRYRSRSKGALGGSCSGTGIRRHRGRAEWRPACTAARGLAPVDDHRMVSEPGWLP